MKSTEWGAPGDVWTYNNYHSLTLAWPGPKHSRHQGTRWAHHAYKSTCALHILDRHALNPQFKPLYSSMNIRTVPALDGSTTATTSTQIHRIRALLAWALKEYHDAQPSKPKPLPPVTYPCHQGSWAQLLLPFPPRPRLGTLRSIRKRGRWVGNGHEEANHLCW